MFRLPAFCENCQIVFPSNEAINNGNRNLTVTGCMMTCPQCKEFADVAEGAFTMEKDVLDILSSPDESRRLLDLFAKQVSQAIANDTRADQLLKEIETLNPKMAAFIKAAEYFATKADAKTILAAAAIVFALKSDYQFVFNVDIDLNELAKQCQAIQENSK